MIKNVLYSLVIVIEGQPVKCRTTGLFVEKSVVCTMQSVQIYEATILNILAILTCVYLINFFDHQFDHLGKIISLLLDFRPRKLLITLPFIFLPIAKVEERGVAKTSLHLLHQAHEDTLIALFF